MYNVPEQVELEDELCEQCQHGRTKLRPVLVQVSSVSMVGPSTGLS